MSIQSERSFSIDGLQYCNWSRRIFEQMREGRLDAVHVTICYHESFRETAGNIATWNRLFEDHSDLIMPGRDAADLVTAQETGRTAIFFGLQNCSAIEDDIGLVEVLYDLGVRFMQLTYNNQSLLASGCYEPVDGGVTRMGKEVIREMNRLGLAIDMSHSGERSTLEAIALSQRPIAITHANPNFWHEAPRNKSDKVLAALAESGGMIGLSLYPHHLKGGSACTAADFATMAARLAERIGPQHIGIGSDLCQDQPDSVVEWMRSGRWTKEGAAPGCAPKAVFPPQPDWFRDNRQFPGMRQHLRKAGFSAAEADGILGNNWHRFFAQSFAPARPRFTPAESTPQRAKAR
jgi:microsomal dipeptidase-like Zn-dependent dipeptidase